MPIANVRDAVEVEERLYDILDEDDAEIRVGHIRTLFVETLDWRYADGLIPLHNARNEDLPSDAHLIASRDGTSAVYIPLTDAETDRVTAAAANAAARALKDTLSGDLLLLFTNQAGDQFHIIRPDLTQSRPRLQRMVARHGEHHRTVVQQLANMWDDYGRNGMSVHQSIISAFSVEPVTALFFSEYRRIFADAKNRDQRIHGRARAASIHADALQPSDVRVFCLTQRMAQIQRQYRLSERALARLPVRYLAVQLLRSSSSTVFFLRTEQSTSSRPE